MELGWVPPMETLFYKVPDGLQCGICGSATQSGWQVSWKVSRNALTCGWTPFCFGRWPQCLHFHFSFLCGCPPTAFFFSASFNFSLYLAFHFHFFSFKNKTNYNVAFSWVVFISWLLDWASTVYLASCSALRNEWRTIEYNFCWWEYNLGPLQGSQFGSFYQICQCRSPLI